MDGLSPASILKELQELPPNVNPFLFLIEAFEKLTIYVDWPLAYTIVSGVCAGLWLFILLPCVIGELWLNVRKPGSARALFRPVTTVYGTFVQPNVSIWWPLSQILACLIIETSLALNIMNGVTQQHAYSFIIRNLSWSVLFIGGWFRMMHTLMAAFIDFAGQPFASKHRLPHIGSVVNVITMAFGLLLLAAQITTLALAQMHLGRLESYGKELTTALQSFAVEWREGDALPLAQLTTLLPVLEPIETNIQLFARFSKDWAVTLLVTLGVMIVMWTPPSLLQLRLFRTQQKQLSRTRRVLSETEHKGEQNGVTASRLSWRQKSTASAGFDPAIQIERLEALCKSLIISTSVFIVILLALVPLGVLVYIRCAQASQKLFGQLVTLQFAAMTMLTILLVPVNVAIFGKSLLANSIASKPTTVGTATEIQVTFSTHREVDSSKVEKINGSEFAKSEAD